MRSKVLQLKLTQLGPYNAAFTRNGRYMALAGRKGHLALLDWQRGTKLCEVQVGFLACRYPYLIDWLVEWLNG